MARLSCFESRLPCNWLLRTPSRSNSSIDLTPPESIDTSNASSRKTGRDLGPSIGLFPSRTILRSEFAAQ
ncbi:hypothetical protein G6O67_000603 [Ophiocordyceps sinensis]|uniref:Uncharacterized protein n=1 Tax=Ophiocordyceps sinensis TaxID=72228 RepID=A0A8H4PZS6_9HYPO|nr:hypothetical protein G6O67_000603 [Ophiocordyceps sinensis]